ncbi:hypothetical protein [Undibacterium curvum]|uniref:Uncharacterized protein n=1 Tax=Undibacterium curvum TaxID=2762294 RepID=A0ABR7A171_9BURK|nr:hypothetical protein [Undibacterium curvum]MBC3930663.1 hypothetical protein [Undibacterium curvum]
MANTISTQRRLLLNTLLLSLTASRATKILAMPVSLPASATAPAATTTNRLWKPLAPANVLH